MFKKKQGDSRLDLLLKEGANKDRKKIMEIDKAVASTTHRLLREKIQFAKAVDSINVADQYRQSGYILLKPHDEKKATDRLKTTPKSTRKVLKRPKPKKAKV